MNVPAQITPPRDRAWWRIEARRTKTDWSSVLRQRVRVIVCTIRAVVLSGPL